jgi:hypothetical protein
VNFRDVPAKKRCMCYVHVRVHSSGHFSHTKVCCTCSVITVKCKERCQERSSRHLSFAPTDVKDVNSINRRHVLCMSCCLHPQREDGSVNVSVDGGEGLMGHSHRPPEWGADGVESNRRQGDQGQQAKEAQGEMEGSQAGIKVVLLCLYACVCVRRVCMCVSACACVCA